MATTKKTSGQTLTATQAVQRSAWPVDPTFFSFVRRRLGGAADLTSAYKQNPWVYTATRAIATNIGALPFQLYKESDEEMARPVRQKAVRAAFNEYPVLRRLPEDARALVFGGRSPRDRVTRLLRLAPWLSPELVQLAVPDVDPVMDGKWVELFYRPNEFSTFEQIIHETIINLVEDGMCFWRLDGISGGAKKAEIPEFISVFGAEGWELKIEDGVPKRWEVKLPTGPDGKANAAGKVTKYALESIAYFRHATGDAGWKGQSELEALKNELQSYHWMTTFNAAFFREGAHPSGFFETETVIPGPAQKEFLDSIEERHRTPEKAHRPGMLPKGVKFVENKTRHRDMEFQSGLSNSRDTILPGLGASKANVGIVEDVNRANNLEQQKRFWNDCLLPRSRYLSAIINHDVLTEDRAGGLFGVFDTSGVEALQENLAEKTETAKRLFDMMVPLNDINERMGLGLEAYAWGDSAYRSTTLVPVNEREETPEPEEPEEDSDPDKKPAEKKPKPASDDEEDEGKGTAAPVARTRSAANEQLWLDIQQKLFAPAEIKFASRFGRAVYALRLAQLALITQETYSTADEVPLFELGVQRVAFHKAFKPVALETAKAAAADMNAVLDAAKHKALRATNEDGAIIRLAEQTAASMSRSAKTIRASIYKRLLELFAEIGREVARGEIVKAIKEVINSLRGRTGMVARLGAGISINGARDIVMRQREVPRGEWITAEDERVRDTHVEYGLAGPQDIGTNFANIIGAGDSYTLEYPLDMRAPLEETANCRCVLVPTLEG